MVYEGKRASSRKSSKDEKIWYKEAAIYIKNNWKTLFTIGALFLLLVYFKVQEEKSYQTTKTVIKFNPYEVLEVSKAASASDIKKSYLKLAAKYHPDKNPNCETCPEKFEKLKTSYDILSNPEKKIDYDSFKGSVDKIPSSTEYFENKDFYKNKPIIVQVFDDLNENCQSFAAFWEDFATKYDFLIFKRIHARKDSKLVKKLPFAVEDYPFVLTLFPGRVPEVLDLIWMESATSAFTNLLRQTIGQNYIEITETNSKNFNLSDFSFKIILNKSGFRPIFFDYASLRLKSVIDFYFINSSSSRARILGQHKVGVSGDLIVGHKNNYQGHELTKESVKKSIGFLTGKQIVNINRLLFEELCHSNGFIYKGQDSIYDQAFCILILENDKQANWVEEAIEIMNKEISKEEALSKTKIQFGRISMKTNKVFSRYVDIRDKFICIDVFSNQYKYLRSVQDFEDLLEDIRENFKENFLEVERLIEGDDLAVLIRDNRVSVIYLFFKEFYSNMFNKIVTAISSWFILSKLGVYNKQKIILICGIIFAGIIVSFRRNLQVYGISLL